MADMNALTGAVIKVGGTEDPTCEEFDRLYEKFIETAAEILSAELARNGGE